MKEPVRFSPEVWERVLEALAAGGTLRSIEVMHGMPCAEAIRKWLRDKPELRASYGAARQEASDAFEAEIIEQARSAALAPDINPAAAKLHIETLRWVAERRDPKRYGLKQSLEHSGPDGAPIEIKGGGISAILAAANKHAADAAGPE